MDKLLAYEKEKYRELWGSGPYRGPNAVPFAEGLSSVIWGHCLDIGCGDCATMDELNKNPLIKCSGLDIVTDQCPEGREVYEGTIWQMPFRDNQFDFTLSTDVLEHIPTEKIEEAIQEIGRVTKRKTFHYISTWPAVTEYQGEQVHLTVREPDWWERMFKEHCGVEYRLTYW